MTHDEVSLRAYRIWEQTGRPDGYDTEHWLQAEHELHEQDGEKHIEELEKCGGESEPGRGYTRRPWAL